MLPKYLKYSIFFFLFVIFIYGCNAIIEPSLSKKQLTLEAPADQSQSPVYTINFWWDQLDNASGYRLQVVTPNFNAPASLVLDTLVKSYRFSYNFNPGVYQWHVRAENGSSQTAYTAARNFTILQSSIKQQSVQLSLPANNAVTNQAAVLYQWSALYGATQYRFEIDTNNFANESSIVSNQVIPGQQLSFTFPTDQTYQWRVRAENDTAQAKWSAIYLITYDHTPPGQVSIISPASGQTLSLPVSFQWATTPTAVKYKVYVFKSDSTTLYSSGYPAVTNGTGYNFNSGNSGDKIYWQVSALDAAGNEGKPSALKNFVLK